MTRRIWPVLTVAVGIVALSFIQAQDPAKPKGPEKSSSAAQGEAILKQEILARQFREFEQHLLRLAQRLERSTKQEDRDRAVVLKKAIKLASEEGIDNRFDRLIGILRESKAVSLEDIGKAIAQNEQLTQDLRAMLAILLTDNREAQLKEEIKRLTNLLKELDKIIRNEKTVRAQTESGRMDKNDLGKAQNKVTKSAQGLAKAMSKDGKGEGKEGKEGAKGKEGKDDPKEKKGGTKEGKKKEGEKKEGKEGEKGEGKSGEGKSGNKSGDKKSGSQGKPKEGSGQEGKQPPPPPQSAQQPGMPGRKQVEDAIEQMKKAEENIRKNRNPDASKNQDEAIKKLEEARKRLEEILRQLREEEIERLLANLQNRCERMLQMQILVHEGTVLVHKAVTDNPEQKPTRANEQKSLQLSDREGEIVVEANKAIAILEAEGSAVAFPEVFMQVRDDMVNVQRRLGKADVGTVTQVIEQEIITTLKEMIEALKRARQESQNRRSNPPPPGGQPPNQKLIDLLAELKMIRSMQVRVNTRTLTYAKQYPGEQADDPDIQRELRNLAQRQQKIFEVTRNIATGKNQ